MSKAKNKSNAASQPVYLLVVDSSEEFQVALVYAAKLAQANGARLALLHALDKEGFFQQWGGVQERLHEEYRQEAEGELLKAAMVINERSSTMPALYLKEAGNLAETILETIDNDPNISKLILGGAAHSSSPGPLVSYFAGKGLNKLSVPLTIVPGNMPEGRIDEIL
ncbi:MAG: universal stress protein [Alphaproteobacteria bacterium]|nr:universal stress protein [Alphaproteobacteria bacterium]